MLTVECRQELERIGLRFHDLRHECAGRWIEGGVPLHTVRDWLGHADVGQTRTYVNSSLDGQDDMRRFDEKSGFASSLQGSTGSTLGLLATTTTDDGRKPMVN